MQAERIAMLSTALEAEKKRRKKLINEVIDLKGNIRVYCRVRPLNRTELAAGASETTSDYTEEQLMFVEKPTDMPKKYSFDRVFAPNSTQDEVFQDVAPLVDSCVNGYTVCIFAYGQTGSGKTYTMEGGPGEARGVNYRALDYLFTTLAEERAQNPKMKYAVSLSVVEIYNEDVRDLLNADPAKKMELRAGDEGVFIPGLSERTVVSTQQVQQAMHEDAFPNRSVRGTSMNSASSRSHCLVFIKCTGRNSETGVTSTGTMILIDLAGSERVKKSEATGQSMKEAQAINKSLSALGNVINALQTGSSHVPFRDSKLTYLLKNSLGGNCKCLMICNASPASTNGQETSCSFMFAHRVRSTKLGQAKKNTQDVAFARETQKAREEANRAQATSSKAKEEMAKAQASSSSLKEQLSAMEQQLNKALSEQNKLAKKVTDQDKDIKTLKDSELSLKQQLKKATASPRNAPTPLFAPSTSKRRPFSSVSSNAATKPDSKRAKTESSNASDAPAATRPKTAMHRRSTSASSTTLDKETTAPRTTRSTMSRSKRFAF
jgi:kinesin family protein C2/C3